MANESAVESGAGPATGSRAAFAGVMIVVLLIRLCIVLAGFVSLNHAPAGKEPRFNFEHPWMAFDARSYRELALHGYAADREGTPYMGDSSFTLTAYFPLWPLAGRLLSHVMPIDIGMVLLANLCSIVGFAFLYDWAERVAGVAAAVVCVLAAATFPGAVFFSAGMTEGPFFLLVCVCLWLIEKDRLLAAALAAGLASGLRPTGIALALVVPLYAWARRRSRPWMERAATFSLLGAISVSGLLAYEGFVWHRYKSPTAYFDAQSHWTRLDRDRLQRETAAGVNRLSWTFIGDRLHRPQVWNRALALIVLGATLSGLIRPQGIPRVFFLFPLVTFLMTSLPGGGLRISSVPRYESAAAPLFLLVGIWLSLGLEWEKMDRVPRQGRVRLPAVMILLLVQFAMQLYYATLFPKQIWVG